MSVANEPPGQPRACPALNDRGLCPAHLTRAEVGVVLLAALGMTDEDAAVAKTLSPHTVRHHIASAMRRAQARSRTELIAKCFAAGILASTWPPAPGGDACFCSIRPDV
jgi:DNA-binding NarL/FixJ family response regulator